MKCPYCSAEVTGDVCEYCGSEMPKEQPAVINNYYGTNPDDDGQTKTFCPKCNSRKINFNREMSGTVSNGTTTGKYKSTSAKKVKGRQNSHTVSTNVYNTVAVCQDCGYSWNPNGAQSVPQAKQRRTWLWVLGWIYIFPLPLTLILLKKDNLKKAVKYGIIAAAWVVFVAFWLFAFLSPSDTSTNASATDATILNSIELIRPEDDITVDVDDIYDGNRYVFVSRFDYSDDVTNDDIVFVSENPEIATADISKIISNSYVYYTVKGVSVGETYIYATSANGLITSDKIKITVTQPIMVENITLSADTNTIALNGSVQLHFEIQPDNAKNKTLTFSSDNESVATVTEDGVVKAVAAGEAVITATSNNGKTATVTIKVDGNKASFSCKAIKSRQDTNNIGDDWSSELLVNGENPSANMTISVGDTITCSAKITESDDNPDVGSNSSTHTVTADDIKNGFDVSFNVTVTENGGKNSGVSANFAVTFSFTPNT